MAFGVGLSKLSNFCLPPVGQQYPFGRCYIKITNPTGTDSVTIYPDPADTINGGATGAAYVTSVTTFGSWSCKQQSAISGDWLVSQV